MAVCLNCLPKETHIYFTTKIINIEINTEYDQNLEKYYFSFINQH